ncbi:FTR1 family protein [Bradyrhizobium liaoningense]
MRFPSVLAAFTLFLFCWVSAPASVRADAAPAQTAWRLLDYISVDYGGAVADSRVVSASEYAEMMEFGERIRTYLIALPPTPAQPALIEQAEALQAAIGRKAPASEVAVLARALASDLLAAYPMPLASSKVPDLAHGAALYQQQCAACHGATGAGDGQAAKGLTPPPTAFTNESRARQRSVFGLYQVIDQGLDGTAMPSFAHLPSDDRWALAFFVGRFAYSDADARGGEQLWHSDLAVRQQIPDLQALTQLTPAALAQVIGDEKARVLTGFLRRHPEATMSAASGTMSLSRARLAESVSAYVAGNRPKAIDLALSAYLDGVEPVEPILKARDDALMVRIEAAMGDLRAAMSKNEPAETVRERAERLSALFDAAERALSPQEASIGSSFAGAFTILLREGLEALLIVVAMIAFLRKAERADVLPYVHGGWIAALAAGGMTWVAATYLISISGASRELTEGFGSLIAAVVLVSVGLWMHGKAQADAWQRYVHEKLSHALSRKSAWFLFLMAFVVVYREVFETVLFYAAMWSQGSGLAILAGAAAGAAMLAVIAWALLSYSRRLPIARFFSLSSILIAILAVILAGKGIAALQEAGMLDILPLQGLPRVEMLGIYPTWQGALAQTFTLIVMLAGFWYTGRAPAVRQ